MQLCGLEGMTGQEGMQIWRSFTVIRLLRRSKIAGISGKYYIAERLVSGCDNKFTKNKEVIYQVQVMKFGINYYSNADIYPPGISKIYPVQKTYHQPPIMGYSGKGFTVPSLPNNPMGGSFVFGLLTSANSLPAFHVPASRI